MLLGDFSEYMKAFDSFLKKCFRLQKWMAINMQNSELLIIIFLIQNMFREWGSTARIAIVRQKVECLVFYKLKK